MEKNCHTKAYFVGASQFRPLFPDSTCVLPISMKQPYCEGDSFEATIHLINSSAFKRCLIVVCDSLHRHTLQMVKNIALNEAYVAAIDFGNRWLESNNSTIQLLNIPCEITRWDCWLKQSQYPIALSQIDLAYQTNPEFKNAFHSASQKFITRFQSNFYKNKGEFFQRSIEYLKEECAVLPLWLEENYDFVIYPGEKTEALEATYKFYMEPVSSTLIKWLRVNFKKSKYHKNNLY